MKTPWYRYLAIYCLFLATAGYIALHRERAEPLARPLADFPARVGAWRTVHQEQFSQELLDVLRPSDYLSRRYLGPDGKTVNLYIGYHDGAQGSGPIHSPKNCLPGSGWFEVASRPVEFDVGGERVRLTQAIYRQGERQELFVYWFMVRGEVLSTEIGLKLAEIANSVQHGQRGASFVRLNLGAQNDPAEAASVAESFIKQAYPVIHFFLAP
uniref:EpsI family protein n=1 Tax=Desulfovibrio sp. U5L TaxID=596152 RepID=I2Q349_9BACT